jgi:hypothetical protein
MDIDPPAYVTRLARRLVPYEVDLASPRRWWILKATREKRGHFAPFPLSDGNIFASRRDPPVDLAETSFSLLRVPTR